MSHATIEEICTSVAQGSRAGIKTLTQQLRDATPRQFALWPEADRTAWTAGLEAVLERFSRGTSPADELSLLLELLAVGCAVPDDSFVGHEAHG